MHGYSVPSATHNIIAEVAKRKFTSRKTAIKSDLQTEVEFFAFTTDNWTSRDNNAYTYVTYLSFCYQWMGSVQKHLRYKKMWPRTTSNCNHICNRKVWYLVGPKMVLNELVYNIMQVIINSRWKKRKLCTYIDLYSTFQSCCFPI